MPIESLIRSLVLPELKLVDAEHAASSIWNHLKVEKVSDFEVCPRCATPSRSIYDRRTCVVKDAPLRDRHVILHIRKRRFSCGPCKKPFTEPVPGIRKGSRTTERYKRALLAACENFSDLSAVRRTFACSAGYLYRALYQQLELRRRTRLHPWPKIIGIDEHFFQRNRTYGFREFASVLVDYRGRRLMEVVQGKRIEQLNESLAYIPGRENVRWVVLDMSDTFRSFARGFFPNATLVADKFHVLRLLSPAINRRRKAITGDRRTLPLRRLLLCNYRNLDPDKRFALRWWLHRHPELEEVYWAKEALHGFYRIRGPHRAARALDTMLHRMAASALPEIQTLRRTLSRWRKEVLAYFWARITNGRTEGFNTKAKLVKRRAYGYRSFQNYRLRLLNACA